MLRTALANILPRWLAILLGIRRVVPTDDKWPMWSVAVPPIDTGGAFRAAWRQQDPSKDPKEPNGSESSSTGNDHGWSNCTMTAGALALAYQQPRGSLAPWGGDLRHRQGDLSGGTDLYDLRDAWETYGESLSIKSGQGWSAVVDCHDDGRAIVIQGTGNVPGSESFDGGHACCIAPETHSDGDWLFGDPLASGWQWVSPSSIRSWAERWQSSIAFAAGEKPPSDPPTPTPVPCPPIPPETPRGPEIDRAYDLGVVAGQDASVSVWMSWIGAPKGGAWDAVGWGPFVPSNLDDLDDCGGGVAGGVWGRGPLPDPVASAILAGSTPGAWSGSGWTASTWA